MELDRTFEERLVALLNACCTKGEVLSLRSVVFHHEKGSRTCLLCHWGAKLRQAHAWDQHVMDCPFALAMRRVGLAPLTHSRRAPAKKARAPRGAKRSARLLAGSSARA